MNSNIPIEIERKYIIAMPDTETLGICGGYTVSDIEQTYLKSDSRTTRRVRKRTYGKDAVYTLTEKVRIDKISSYENERNISEAEYNELLGDIRGGSSVLKKTRHTFVYLGKTFEVDIYPQWSSTAIMEIELESRDETVEMPEFITVLAEVTGVKKYTNSSMASSFPEEIV